ncbi:MAG: hypothetical protein ACI854_001860 [Arenicella sp.]|jgi:hypothetical protein
MKKLSLKRALKTVILASALGWMSSASAIEIVNLVTKEAGMHRITYEELASYGADFFASPKRNFGLSLDGEPVALTVKGQHSRFGKTKLFGPGGYIEFYAPGSDSRYTDEQKFTLHSLSNKEIRNGQRIFIRNQYNTVNKTAPMSQQFQYTHVEHQNNRYSFTSPIANDPWDFGFTVSVRATPTYTFVLDNVADGDASAKVDAQMVGFVDLDIEGNDHHYEVLVNGFLLGDQQFDGNSVDHFVSTDAVVQEGANSFKFNYRPLVDVPFDKMSLNQLRVTYSRTTEMADNNGYLEGWFDADQALISNVSSASVYRKYEDGMIRQITGVQTIDDSIVFSTNGRSGNYIIVSNELDNSGFKVPEVRAIASAVDISSGRAEYLIIAHPSLIGESLNELVDIRSQDYLVKVVDVNQVYAQYGNHNFGYQGIDAYIKHAVANMSTRYVVLVGNDTYDYKNFKYPSVSLMPTKYLETKIGGLLISQTPSDAAYGDVNDDGVPDVAIGRIGARTSTELGYVVNKIKAYRAREGYVGRLLMATDKDDLGLGVNFTSDAQDLINAMPADWAASLRDDFRAFPEVDGHQEAHEKVINVMNAGVSVVEYIGHSSQYSWAYTTPPLLSVLDIPGLTNIGKPTVVTQWGCWNTYYVDPRGYAMGDRLMLGGEYGAVTVLGASSLTTSQGERGLGIELNKRLFEKGVTIGDALIAAKKALAEDANHPDIQLSWQILGDPAIVINP